VCGRAGVGRRSATNEPVLSCAARGGGSLVLGAAGLQLQPHFGCVQWEREDLLCWYTAAERAGGSSEGVGKLGWAGSMQAGVQQRV
jgi:hypothetical protein